MNENTAPLPEIGSPFEGGFFVGTLFVGDQAFALVRAPKAEGQHDDTPWNDDWVPVEGAGSYNDGLTNTAAMAAAGSEVATWARERTIAGHGDWYIPAQDELELCYRALKPGTDTNTLYGRSGLNASAMPATYPYTNALPAQTPAAGFQTGGAEAFDEGWYWSSTQRAGYGGFAWCQSFGDGHQYDNLKDVSCRVLLVRRIPFTY